MKKRIFRSMMLLTIISLSFLSIALCSIYYEKFKVMTQAEIKLVAESFSENDKKLAIENAASIRPHELRISIIENDGNVIYDNTVLTEKLENHNDRKEILEALRNSRGESKRKSTTLDKETYYYAIKLTDGNILRVSKTVSTIFGIFLSTLPLTLGIIFLIIIIGYILASILVKKLVEPINKSIEKNILQEPYPELAPFVKTIKEQRKNIEIHIEELKERNKTISVIMDSMDEGMIILNKQGTILSMNKSILNFFDRDIDYLDKNIVEFFRNTEFISQMKAALNNERKEMNFEYLDRTFKVIFSPVKDNGEIIFFIDITERLKADNMRKEFSANVSHELKTPLTSIYGNTEMLINGIVKDEDKQDFYIKIKDETARLITLIEDIISISKIYENNDESIKKDLDLHEVARSVIKTLKEKADENVISLNLLGEKTNFTANPTQMYQLFYNLIENAIKYNKINGKVNISTEKKEDKIIIEVADTGIGIPEMDKERVFERFFRVDKSRSKKTGGSGLGLAIVKHIVLSNNGKILLDSKENKGTSIKIIF